jgi:hypothetical protein
MDDLLRSFVRKVNLHAASAPQDVASEDAVLQLLSILTPSSKADVVESTLVALEVAVEHDAAVFLACGGVQKLLALVGRHVLTSRSTRSVVFLIAKCIEHDRARGTTPSTMDAVSSRPEEVHALLELHLRLGHDTIEHTLVFAAALARHGRALDALRGGSKSYDATDSIRMAQFRAQMSRLMSLLLDSTSRNPTAFARSSLLVACKALSAHKEDVPLFWKRGGAHLLFTAARVQLDDHAAARSAARSAAEEPAAEEPAAVRGVLFEAMAHLAREPLSAQQALQMAQAEAPCDVEDLGLALAREVRALDVARGGGGAEAHEEEEGDGGGGGGPRRMQGLLHGLQRIMAVRVLREALSADVGVLIKHAALVSSRACDRAVTDEACRSHTAHLVLMTRHHLAARRQFFAPSVAEEELMQPRDDEEDAQLSLLHAHMLGLFSAVHAQRCTQEAVHVEVRTHAAFLVIMCAMPMVLARTAVRLLPDLMRDVRDALGACEAGAQTPSSTAAMVDRRLAHLIAHCCDFATPGSIVIHGLPQSSGPAGGARSSPSRSSTRGDVGCDLVLFHAARFFLGDKGGELLARGVPTSLAAEAVRTRLTRGLARALAVSADVSPGVVRYARDTCARYALGERAIALVAAYAVHGAKDLEDKPEEEEDDDAGADGAANAPSPLLCPITLETMRMPVLASDGHCYEMEGMLHLFRHGWARSPLTREALEPWVVYARFVHDVQRWKRAAGGAGGAGGVDAAKAPPPEGKEDVAGARMVAVEVS